MPRYDQVELHLATGPETVVNEKKFTCIKTRNLPSPRCKQLTVYEELIVFVLNVASILFALTLCKQLPTKLPRYVDVCVMDPL